MARWHPGKLPISMNTLQLRYCAPELDLCREIPWNGHSGGWKRASGLLLEFIVTLVTY